LQQEGQNPDLDSLRSRLSNSVLAQKALDLQQVGRQSVSDRPTWFQRIVEAFQRLRTREAKELLKNQLTAASDHETAVELLKRLQNQTFGTDLKLADGAGEKPAIKPPLPTGK